MHDGGTYSPSQGQRIIWQQYEEGINNVATLRKGKQLILTVNGDPVEGMHHDTTQLITSRIEEQEDIFSDVFDWTLKQLKFNEKKGDKLFFTTGTPAHGDNGNQSDERIASQFDGVVKMRDARYTWDRLLLDINGVMFDIAHQGPSPGSRAWTRENGLRNTLKSIYFDALNNNSPIPDWWIRSHVHTYVKDTYHGLQQDISGVLTPALQLKTEHAYKNHSVKLAHIGIVYMTIKDNGKVDYYDSVLRYNQDRVLTI